MASGSKVVSRARKTPELMTYFQSVPPKRKTEPTRQQTIALPAMPGFQDRRDATAKAAAARQRPSSAKALRRPAQGMRIKPVKSEPATAPRVFQVSKVPTFVPKGLSSLETERIIKGK